MTLSWAPEHLSPDTGDDDHKPFIDQDPEGLVSRLFGYPVLLADRVLGRDRVPHGQLARLDAGTDDGRYLPIPGLWGELVKIIRHPG